MPTMRQAKVAEMIKRELAEILQREMRDPRMAMATVTEVEVARDFTFAKVFISTMGNEKEKAEALKAIQGAAGFLRGQLGRRIELRSVPQLVFRYDTGIDRGARIFDLLQGEARPREVPEVPEGVYETPRGHARAADDEEDA